MLRSSLSLLKQKALLECFSNLNLGPICSRFVHGGGGGGGIFSSWGSADYNRTSGLFEESTGLQVQQVRHGHKYVVKDLSVLWYRRRRKAMEQRLKVLNPSSPVIEHRDPLPQMNEGRYPPDLFAEEQVKDYAKEEEEKRGVVAEINRQIVGQKQRLFAIINVKGKQFKVTPEDIIIIQGYWAPDIGDRLRLHKVLLLGGSDFTLLGRPILDNSLFRVEGTVIEKTLSYTKLHFRLKKRKNFRRLKFSRDPYTMLRINMVELINPISTPNEVVEKEPEIVEGRFNVAMQE